MSLPNFADNLPDSLTSTQRILIQAALTEIKRELLEDPRWRENFALVYGKDVLDELLLG